jgi:hypothetical protein
VTDVTDPGPGESEEGHKRADEQAPDVADVGNERFLLDEGELGLDEDELERLAQLSVQAQEQDTTGDPQDADVESERWRGRIAEPSRDGEWLARDGVWRSFESDPPVPGEVVDTRYGPPSVDVEAAPGEAAERRSA